MYGIFVLEVSLMLILKMYSISKAFQNSVKLLTRGDCVNAKPENVKILLIRMSGGFE